MRLTRAVHRRTNPGGELPGLRSHGCADGFILPLVRSPHQPERLGSVADDLYLITAQQPDGGYHIIARSLAGLLSDASASGAIPRALIAELRQVQRARYAAIGIRGDWILPDQLDLSRVQAPVRVVPELGSGCERWEVWAKTYGGVRQRITCARFLDQTSAVASADDLVARLRRARSANAFNRIVCVWRLTTLS